MADTYPLTIRPMMTAELVLRFADGTERALGTVTMRADMDVTISSDSGSIDYSSLMAL